MDSFGRHWKLGDLAAEIANRRESNGWNPASESRKFNGHEQMRIRDLLPGRQPLPEAVEVPSARESLADQDFQLA